MIFVTLKGIVSRGHDGLHHEQDCCQIPRSLTPEERGLENSIFFEMSATLGALPAVGDNLYLRKSDGEYEQEFVIRKRAFHLDGTIDLWIGGWTHWNTDHILDLLKYNRGEDQMKGKTQRNKEIIHEFEEGYTLQTIGNRHGITRERVRQIVDNSRKLFFFVNKASGNLQ
jgi:Sigma-70, region 4